MVVVGTMCMHVCVTVCMCASGSGLGGLGVNVSVNALDMMSSVLQIPSQTQRENTKHRN